MKNIIIFLAFIAVFYQGWNSIFNKTSQPSVALHEEPYVIVYGRKTCGFTQQTMKDLKRKNVPFKFNSVDDKSVANVLHNRMRESGIETRRYDLPVVDSNNNLSVRPKVNAIISDYYD